MSGLTLDAGALIGLERGDRAVVALLAAANETATALTVPATVLAQVIRQPERQARITRLLRSSATSVAHLDHPAAIATGRLLARSGTSDIADAHVAVTAAAQRDAVVTSDTGDLTPLVQLASQPAVHVVSI